LLQYISMTAEHAAKTQLETSPEIRSSPEKPKKVIFPEWDTFAEKFVELPKDLKKGLKIYYKSLTLEDETEANLIYDQIDPDLFTVYKNDFDNVKAAVVEIRNSTPSEPTPAPSSDETKDPSAA